MTHTVQLFSVVFTHEALCTNKFKWHALSHLCHRERRPIHSCRDAQLIEVYLLVCMRIRKLLVFYQVDFVKWITFQPWFIVLQSPLHPNWFFTSNMTYGFRSGTQDDSSVIDSFRDGQVISHPSTAAHVWWIFVQSSVNTISSFLSSLQLLFHPPLFHSSPICSDLSFIGPSSQSYAATSYPVISLSRDAPLGLDKHGRK